MKTSVTIPDATLRTADELARRMGISRSSLVALALERLIQKRRDDEAISAKVNEVLAHESSSLDPVLAEIQYRSIEKNKWQREFSRNTNATVISNRRNRGGGWLGVSGGAR